MVELNSSTLGWYGCTKWNRYQPSRTPFLRHLQRKLLTKQTWRREVYAKDYSLHICCFSTKHIELKSKSKDWLTRNQDDVSNWSSMSTWGPLFRWFSPIKIELDRSCHDKAKNNCSHSDQQHWLLSRQSDMEVSIIPGPIWQYHDII